MLNTTLLHQLITASAERAPDAPALTAGKTSLSYRELDDQVASIAAGLVGLGLDRGERVGIFLDKRTETVVASFAAARAGGVFVPVTLKRMGFDPALAGGVILTTITDVMGFLTFLGLATLVLLR